MKDKEKTSTFEKILSVIKTICIIILLFIIAVLMLQRFSNNERAIAGMRIFNVATTSMVPKYVVGDVLLVKEVDPDTLQKGDDITYLGEQGSFKNRVVTHQIIEIEEVEGKKIYHTKGIANDTEDPTITADRIYGKVIYKSRIISMLTKLMNNMTALYIVIFIPVGIIIFSQIKAHMDSKKDDDEEDEDDDEEEGEE